MGRSATGTVIFGIAYEEEGITPDTEFLDTLGIDPDLHIDFDEVATRAMEKKLDLEAPKDFDFSVYEQRDGETYSQAQKRGERLYAQWKKTDGYKAMKSHRDMIRSKINEIGVEVRHHCHTEFPLPYICTYSISGGGGHATEIDLQAMLEQDTEQMTQQIKEFCDLVKLPYRAPSWQLIGYYG